MKSNLRFYRTFHDFDATFADAMNAALDLLEAQLSDVTSTYLIAESSQGPAGCIFFSSETSTAGRIRLFYLEQAYRGQGIGARLLRRVLTKARRGTSN
jgi:GNAT superfamily N-acetyltransferase